jgi:hypothetical protein
MSSRTRNGVVRRILMVYLGPFKVEAVVARVWALEILKLSFEDEWDDYELFGSSQRPSMHRPKTMKLAATAWSFPQRRSRLGRGKLFLRGVWKVDI